MTNHNSHLGNEAREMLADQGSIVKYIRTTQRATSFPLAVLAIATFLAIPMERISHRTVGNCSAATVASSTPHFCRIFSYSGLFYWPIALVISYAVISFFYTVKSREVGAETNARKYVIPGVIITILLSLASYLLFLFSSGRHSVLGLYFLDPSNAIIFRMIGPSFSIGLALLFLARFERNTLLLIFDLLYGAVVLWPPVRGVRTSGFWSLAPNRVIDGALLLAAAIVFKLLEQRRAKKRI